MRIIIAIEIPKLRTPDLDSVEIKGPKRNYYIYPGTFTKTLGELNTEITEVYNSMNYENIKFLGHNYFFEREEGAYSYIVTKVDINLNQSAENIMEDLRYILKPLLFLFNFLFSEIFTINKVFFFKKYIYGYKFLKMLETPNYHKELSKANELKRFISIYDVENVFSFILARICGKEKYLEFIEGYLVGKVRSPYISNKIFNYWNCLEHFAQKFAKEECQTRILEKKTMKNLNKIIRGALNLIKQEDVVFPNLELQEVLSKGLVLPNNNPPIINKILYLCSKNHIKITEEEEKTIRLIYEIRNKLYHEETYLIHLLGRLTKKFGLENPTLIDISKFSRKFALIVEKIILRYFKIIPYHFNLKPSEYYHFLDDKKIKLPSLDEKQRKKIEYIHERHNMEGLSERERILKHLKSDKKDLLSKGKFLSVIKYIDRLKQRIYNFTQENFVAGTLKSKYESLNIKIKFERDLKGSLKFLTRDKLAIAKIRKSEMLFQSNLTSLSNNFRMNFILLFSEISYTLDKNPTGTFLTFIIEIKEAVE